MSDLEQLRELKVQTQIKDPSYEFKGEIHIDPALADWHDIAIVDEDACEHLETMCHLCGPSWLEDHWVRIVSPDGRMLGINEVPGLPSLMDGDV